MDKIKNKAGVFTVMILAMTMWSCADFLNEKSDSKLVTPETLQDNQALLDKISNLLGSTSISGVISSDELYINDSDYNSISYDADKRLYTWQPDYVARATGNDWQSCFFRINICNTVLQNLEDYHIQNAENIKGQALTIRASVYLEAAQVWCPAYKEASASSDWGLPLRLDPDINKPSVRANLQQTYDQILADLHEAVSMLPDNQMAVTRASKRTAFAFLARTYLFMGRYNDALVYANKALGIKGDLLDYNTLNPADSYPIKPMNQEIILPTNIAYSPVLSSTVAKIPDKIFNMYDDYDLRKTLYFRKNADQEILFRGNYSGASTRSSVMATDELYLIAAECYAQLGNLPDAMLKLNTLLVNRYKTGTYQNRTASTKPEALGIIAQERQKELVLRDTRWSDLKRYNRDGANIMLSRTVNGEVFTLPPNDPRYAIAIPEDIIKQTGMPKNPR